MMAIPLDEAVCHKAAPRLAAALRRLGRAEKPLDANATFFDFEGKVNAVVEGLAPYGLTRPVYLSVLKRNPSVLLRSPETIIDLIEQTSTALASAGLTERRLLVAATKFPALLVSTPEKLTRNIIQVAEHLAQHGLDQPTYLQMVLRRPILWARKPASVIANFEELARLLADGGLTGREVAGLAGQQPNLLTYQPSAIVRRLERLLAHRCCGRVPASLRPYDWTRSVPRPRSAAHELSALTRALR